MKFSGKNVLVTGASRRWRRDLLVLAGYGLKVWINYRSKPEIADALKAEIESSGGKAAVVEFDVTDEEAFVRGLQAITQRVMAD